MHIAYIDIQSVSVTVHARSVMKYVCESRVGDRETVDCGRNTRSFAVCGFGTLLLLVT